MDVVDTSTELNHPMSHTLAGERLYYLLLKCSEPLHQVKQKVLCSIEDSNLKEQSCAYLLFGECDALIRVWSCEESLLSLKKSLKENNIHIASCMLTSNIYTWYQVILEDSLVANNTDIFKTISEHPPEKFLAGTPPSKLVFSFSPDDPSQTKTRFFILLKSSFPGNYGAFQKLKTILYEGEQKDLSKSMMLSIYSFYTNEHKGVLIKGQIDAIGCKHSGMEKLQEIVREYGSDSITYISSEPILSEGDNIGIYNDDVIVPARKQCAVYNLVKLHDCLKEEYENDSTQRHRAEMFIETLSSMYDLLANYNSAWKSNIDNAKRIFRWVVKGRNEALKSFFALHYIETEKKLRDLYLKHGEKLVENRLQINPETRIRNIITSKVDKDVADQLAHKVISDKTLRRSKRDLTFGSFYHLISDTCKLCGNKHEWQVEKAKIRELQEIVKACSECRNELFHGKVDNIFSTDTSKTQYLFQKYVKYYIQFSFTWPDAKLILIRCLSELAQ